MKKISYLFFVLIFFSGCENIKKGLGMKKDAPDEFLIEKRNPLVMPPNFDLLPPDSTISAQTAKEEKDNLKDIFNKSLSSDKKDLENKSTLGNLEKSILEKIK